ASVRARQPRRRDLTPRRPGRRSLQGLDLHDVVGFVATAQSHGSPSLDERTGIDATSTVRDLNAMEIELSTVLITKEPVTASLVETHDHHLDDHDVKTRSRSKFTISSAVSTDSRPLL